MPSVPAGFIELEWKRSSDFQFPNIARQGAGLMVYGFNS